MDSLTRSTELEAVNTILSVMGESPINSLSVEGDLAVASAEAVLKEVSRNVQSKGWYFNREREYSMALDVDDFIPIAANILEITPDGNDRGKPYTQRGDFLYNIEDQTFEFTAAVSCTVIWFLDWTDMPEAARRYITIVAARTAQERDLGSESINKFTADDEAKALQAVNRAEIRMGRVNSLTGSWSVYNIIRGRRN